MQLSFLIAKDLLEGDFASYFASVPSAAYDPEPIVVREGRFEREARMEDEERILEAQNEVFYAEARVNAKPRENER